VGQLARQFAFRSISEVFENDVRRDFNELLILRVLQPVDVPDQVVSGIGKHYVLARLLRIQLEKHSETA